MALKNFPATLAACVLLLVCSATFAQQDKPDGLASKPLTPPEKIETLADAGRFLNTYYLQPRPMMITQAFRIESQSGVLAREAPRAPFIVFIGMALRQDDAPLAELLKFASTLPMEQSGVIYSGIWFAGTDKTQAALKQAAADAGDAAVRDAILKLLENQPPDLTTIPIESPSVIDMCWAWFMVTGDTQAVQRIITALPWMLDKTQVKQYMIGNYARASLASNAVQHAAVLAYCKRSLEGQTAETQHVLQDVIDAAEKRLAPEGEK